MPRALRLAVVRVGRWLHDTHRITELVDRHQLHHDTAVDAVVADAPLVPGEVVLLLGHPVLERRLHTRRRALDRIAAHRTSAAAARIEAPRVSLGVLAELHVAVAVRPDEVATHRLEGEVHVGPQRLVPRVPRDVELLVSRREQRADDRVPEFPDDRFAPIDDGFVEQPVQVVDVAVLDLAPDLLQLGQAGQCPLAVARATRLGARPDLGLELRPAEPSDEGPAVRQVDQVEQAPVELQQLRPRDAPAPRGTRSRPG